jgi:hypothetical protein
VILRRRWASGAQLRIDVYITFAFVLHTGAFIAPEHIAILGTGQRLGVWKIAVGRVYGWRHAVAYRIAPSIHTNSLYIIRERPLARQLSYLEGKDETASLAL